ncbi:MAG: isochorismatase family protein [Phycisphaerae bacterium]|jgi:nicotinamidase-related amidase
MCESLKRDVIFDMCVQREYLSPDSPYCCTNAGQIFRNLKRLMAYARWSKTPILSCVDVDCANRIGEQFVALRGAEAPVRQRYAFGLVPGYEVVESDNSLCVALDILSQHPQVIFTKVHRDPYTNPKLDRLLTEMPARRFVIFGLPLESSVRMLALGLVRRNRRVVVIDDACGYWNAQEAAMVIRKLLVKGCEVTSTVGYIRDRMAQIGRSRRIRVRLGRWVA